MLDKERINRFRNLSTSSKKTSILDELIQLEEQVVLRVQKELEHYSNPTTPTLQTQEVTQPFLHPDTDSQGEQPSINSNSPWMNFISYLPWLKSIASTKELTEKMTNQQLAEFANVLSKVVNGNYSSDIFLVT
jgi:nicotinic acid phosphoribosyltransferase